mmetsp:Transcript_9439/g.19614  ORF Transcript_9439/g.19614 Transcript_9439/m.19614 type:complete len:142 (+) Transcript_9439:1864-2289(+)
MHWYDLVANSFQYSAVVVSMVMLADPAVGAIQGFLVGVSPMPGIQTWIGDLIVVVGSTMVICSGMRKTDRVDVTEVVAESQSQDALIGTPKLFPSPRHSLSGQATRRSLQRTGDREFGANVSSNRQPSLTNDAGGNRVIWE